MALFKIRRNRGTRNGKPSDVHPVDEVMPPVRMMAYGVQHIAAMYAGVVAPPLIVGEAMGLPPIEMTLLIGASLFTAGLATMLQSLGIWKIGARLPFVNGVTFGSVAPMLAIVAQQGQQHSLSVIYGSVLIAGLLAFLIAPYFSRMVRFFPPVVNGTVITLIGLALMPVGIKWITGTDSSAPDYAAPEKIALGGATFALVLLFNRFLKGFWNRIALLIGLVVGTLIAWPMGLINTTTIESAPVFNLPTPFALGAPMFDLTATISICIVMLVAMMETTADMVALGEIVDRPADEETIAAGLRADGAGSALSAVFGGFTCSAFAQNIGLVALTRVRSRYVVATAGGVLVLLGLFPVVGAIVSLVPQPVLGGAALVLFGSVAVSGIRTLGKSDLGDPFNSLIVAGALGIGLVPVISPHFYEHFPSALRTVLDSGISTGCIAALLLNMLFNAWRKKSASTEETVGGDTVAVIATTPGETAVPEPRNSPKGSSSESVH
ncbi:xanthine permease [Saccharopolyspora antimicrobica]|uniref:Xanthine permease n=1 Tax=Saccharopolyspora antimicrobica TaxID=455193 RepID=A0A1I5DE15_9PSEU|nr:nucleobase:cation symporter-2 family protein [Saccharopolyspora antimicrobica]RKT85152.1 xanthine permease [Saccharopolyspora antimicrobica]SFN97357.1 xanthine permease [Saccharopolyspora antimicrobica]